MIPTLDDELIAGVVPQGEKHLIIVDGVEASESEMRLASLLRGIGDFVVLSGGDALQYTHPDELADTIRVLRRQRSGPVVVSNYKSCSKCGKRRSIIARYCQHCGDRSRQ